MVRSIGAIVLGFLLIGALSAGASLVMRAVMPGAFNAAGLPESTALLLLSQAYVAVFAISGCYIAARLAPAAPMRHALILGVLGLLFNVVGTIANWDNLPTWYHVLALALVMPYAWIGGRLRERQVGRAGRYPSVRTAL